MGQTIKIIQCSTKKNARHIILHRLWTCVISKKKKSELDKQFQKYKGRVVLRGDAVKGDSGSYAVFTEHGSSASHCCRSIRCNFATARLRRRSQRCCCSIHSGKIKNMLFNVLILLEGACSVSWICLPRSRSSKIMGQHSRFCGTSGEKCVRTSFHEQDYCGNEKLAEVFLSREGWERIPRWECKHMHRNVVHFYLFTWIIKKNSQKQK